MSPHCEVERQQIEVDIACVGFGPAMGGFLTTLSRAINNEDGTPALESAAMPGMPAQVICYERADDIGFGVSGVVTRARGIKATFPELDPAQIPMATPVTSEKVVYLMDPVGASKRPGPLRMMDAFLRGPGKLVGVRDYAYELPYTPPFLRKHDGLVMSIGQFNNWVGSQLMGPGTVQVWPAMPVAEPLIENNAVVGIRLSDQGVSKSGEPESGYMPGMDVRARLTVVGDGPVGAVGRAIDAKLGIPEGHHGNEWAVGMKFVVELPENLQPKNGDLKPGFVLHTFGYPEPEIFGFLYVHPERLASVGIFVPSWLGNPARTAYRYLQHYIQHPYIWRLLDGSTLRSWGAKSLQESGRNGEPFLAGEGYARIGEGSGSTNVLSGSGVDEAWTTGTQLAEAVIELMKAGRTFTRENLEQTYVARRRASWVDGEAKVAAKSRDGFQKGVVPGLIGMALAGFTKGALSWPAKVKSGQKQIGTMANYFGGRFSPQEITDIKKDAEARNITFHDAMMNAAGWPEIQFDGKLFITHQDALLMGGKVQAPSGYADHVTFKNQEACRKCGVQTCVEMCSGQAIARGEGVPAFDREKCVYCGACLWNCAEANIEFRAGAGGLHSAEN